MFAQTHTPINGHFSGTTGVGRYQKGKTSLDFTEARDGEWQWHQLGRMQVCTSLQTDNHASTPPLMRRGARNIKNKLQVGGKAVKNAQCTQVCTDRERESIMQLQHTNRLAEAHQ